MEPVALRILLGGGGASSGSEHWFALFSGMGSSGGFYALQLDSTGGIYASGKGVSGGVVVALQPDGGVRWQRHLGLSGRAVMDVNIDDAIFVGCRNNDGAYDDLYGLSLDTDGSLNWSTKVDNLYTPAEAELVAVTSGPGAFEVYGSSRAARFDSSGSILWRKVYNMTFYGAARKADGSLLAAGSSSNQPCIANFNTGGLPLAASGFNYTGHALIGRLDPLGGNPSVYFYSSYGWAPSIGGRGRGTLPRLGTGAAPAAIASDGTDDYICGAYGAGALISRAPAGDFTVSPVWQQQLTYSGLSLVPTAILLDPDGLSYIIAGHAATGGQGWLARLPIDGSKAGGYGSLSYTAASPSTATATLPTGTTPTISQGVLSNATASASDATSAASYGASFVYL